MKDDRLRRKRELLGNGMLELNSVTCIDALALCRELPAAAVDLVLTDPPYGAEKTKCDWDNRVDLNAMWAEFKRIIKPKGCIAITSAPPFSAELIMSNLEMYRYSWYWQKPRGANIGITKNQPLRIIEEILIFSKTRACTNQFTNEAMHYFPQMIPLAKETRRVVKAHHREVLKPSLSATFMKNSPRVRQYKFAHPKNLLSFDTDIERGLHPTQKPVALFEYLIRTYTRPGDLVADPFAGSGTTAIAARNTGRHYIVGDFLQEWVDVINRRLSAPFTPPLFTLDEPAPKAETLPLWEDTE